MIRNRLALAATSAMALVLASSAAAPAAAAEALDGYWMDSHGEVILKIGPCGAARCGTVAWLQKPYGPDGLALRDYRNPDPALRDRLVCGIEVVSGFKPQQDGTWGDGTVYVSDMGSSFSGYAEVLSATQVKVTGYVALPIFGMSEVWSKVVGPPGPCVPKEPRSAATKPPPVPVLVSPRATGTASR